MGNISVVSLCLIKEKELQYCIGKMSNPEKVFKFLNDQIGNKSQEHFVVLSLDSKGNVNSFNTTHIGTINSTLIHPREIFKVAIISNASAIILAHNHPSGDATPSEKDIKVTKSLVKASKHLDIEILDHIIVGDNKYFSFKEKGII